MTVMKKIITLIILILLMNSAFGQDRSFVRTYQSIVLPKNMKEIEVWTTYRYGRDDYYRRLDNRFEFEIGLTSKLQTAFYINTSQRSAFNGEEIVTQPTSVSFSNEWKLKLSDPVANAIGSGLYGEYKIGTDEMELEFKLIFDKKIKKSLFAFNAVAEFEFEPEVEDNEVEQEMESVYEFDFGYMYQFNSRWGLGAELRNANVMAEGEWETSPLFLGPTIAYSTENFWVILNAQPQLTNLKKEEGADDLDLSSYEKMDLRLIFSFTF